MPSPPFPRLDLANLAKVPDELKAAPQWVCWRAELRDGKWTKVPVNAFTGGLAQANNPGTWSSFAEAVDAYRSDQGLHGIGFVFGEDDDFFGVDLDNCVKDGQLVPWAQKVFPSLQSYCEVSPSGNGIKFWCRAAGGIPRSGRKAGFPVAGAGVEIYWSHRFFTVTGRRMGQLEQVTDCAEAARKLCAWMWPPKPAQPKPQPTSSLDDLDLLQKARQAANGAAFEALWLGNWELDYGSQSEADAALCSHLAFWTGGDAGRMDHLFRQSGLYREKWDRPDYSERTISHAIENCHDFYSPPTPRSEPARVSHTDSKAEEPKASTAPRRPKIDPLARVYFEADLLREVAERKRKGLDQLGVVKCGWVPLDWFLKGFMPQELYIIAGRPSMGKSALAQGIARGIARLNAKPDEPVLYDGGEMSGFQMAKRAAGQDLNADIHTLEAEHFEGIKPANVAYADGGGDINAFIARAHGWLERYPGTRAIIVDHMGLLKTRKKSGNEDMGAISGSLKRLAQDANIPVIGLCQLSRGVEQRTDKRPVMSDLRDSGELEQDAGSIVFVYRHHYYYPATCDPMAAEVIIAKNRDGEAGITLPFRFRKESCNFWPDHQYVQKLESEIAAKEMTQADYEAIQGVL